MDSAKGELKRLKSESCSDLVRINRQQEEIEKLRENEEQMGCQIKVGIHLNSYIQGGPSGYTLAFVDVKTKVLSQYRVIHLP